jgi:phosphoglucosamine mutase
VPERLFGTDGIRARAGTPPLDRATVTALGRQLGALLVERQTAAPGPRPSPPQVVLGGDTRESTAEICGWLAAGLAAGGAVVRFAGVIPTPGVSFLAGALGAAAGVVVSASHNPYPDNGIKLLDGQGFKWSEAAEMELEERLRAAAGDAGAGVAAGAAGTAAVTGTSTTADAGEDAGLGLAAGAGAAAGAATAAGAGGAGDAAISAPVPALAYLPPGAPLEPEAALREMYLKHLAATVTADVSPAAAVGAPPPLAGLRIALDTGNGAASGYAGELFARLGAEVTLLCAAPDGRNVNLRCGSTAPEGVAAAVVNAGAKLGAAFDGDADRCILVDERGEVRDGDVILYLWATRLAAAGRLAPPAIVATSMSNLGLERALAGHGIEVVRCGVGDRLVVETMRRDGILLGGEQSGHIVRLDLAATGDGLLTAVQMAALVHRAGRPLSELLAGFRRYPQTLVSVRVARKPDLATLPRVTAAARAIEDELGADGRLVLRYSGTEPLVRVMIEGPDQETIETLAGELAALIVDEVGQPAG